MYNLTFSLIGFENERREGIRVDPGEFNTLDIQVRVAQLTQQVEVIGVTPLLGTEIDRDRIPATVSIIGWDELQNRGAPSMADSLNARLGSVSLEGATSNPFNQHSVSEGSRPLPCWDFPKVLPSTKTVFASMNRSAIRYSSTSCPSSLSVRSS